MKEIAKKVKLLEPIDINTISIKRDHYFPGAYTIDLPLDSAPDHVWQDIFERKWKSSRHLWDRKLFVVGRKLRLVTTANHIEDKIDWIKQVTRQTNEAIDKYNLETEARAAQLEEQMKTQKRKERTDIGIIREILRKRFRTL